MERGRGSHHFSKRAGTPNSVGGGGKWRRIGVRDADEKLCLRGAPQGKICSGVSHRKKPRGGI